MNFPSTIEVIRGYAVANWEKLGNLDDNPPTPTVEILSLFCLNSVENNEADSWKTDFVKDIDNFSNSFFRNTSESDNSESSETELSIEYIEQLGKEISSFNATDFSSDQFLKLKRIGFVTSHLFFMIGLKKQEPQMIEKSINDLTTVWQQLVNEPEHENHPYPLSRIIKAWQHNHIPGTEMDRRKTQIAPAFLKQSRAVEMENELPIGSIHLTGEPVQSMLPSFESQSVIVPALPLEVYEAADGKPTKGGTGAPLEQRMFVSALCGYPLGIREIDGAHRLETTLRDITNWLYPTRRFQRQNDLPRIYKALYNLHNMRITYERREWSVVQVFALPNWKTKLDDSLPRLVRMPDGVKGNGAMIDIKQMQLYGVKSAPKFRAWIRLAYFWDEAKIRSGGARIFATRTKVLRNDSGYITNDLGKVIHTGKLYRTENGWRFRKGDIPQTAWYHPLAVRIGEERNPEADKVPVMDSTDFVHLFFDDKPQTNANFRLRKHEALKFARTMHAEGGIVFEEAVICEKTGKRGYRILEPREK